MVDRDSGIPPLLKFMRGTDPERFKALVEEEEVKEDIRIMENKKSPGGYKVKLPVFTGIETASLRADHFIYAVERCTRVNNWSDEAKVNAASLNLRDAAQIWSILYFRNTEDPEKWPVFKAAFLERFHRSTSAADKELLLSKLVQRKTENVDTFMDRIDVTLMDVEDFNTEAGSLHFFLKGVLPNIKKAIESNKDLVTKKDYLAAARTFEKANPHTDMTILINTMDASNGINEQEEPDDDLDKEEEENLNTIMESLNLLFRQWKRKTNHHNKTTKEGTTKGTFSPKSFPIRCFRCGKIGHMRAQCRVPQSIIDAIEEYSADTTSTDPDQPTEGGETEEGEAVYTLNLNC